MQRLSNRATLVVVMMLTLLVAISCGSDRPSSNDLAVSRAMVGRYQAEIGFVNLARGMPTRQSTTLLGANSSRAVDGATNGAWSSGGVTHTGADADAFWEVDLGGVQKIETIRIFPRTDCCLDRYPANGWYVIVSEKPITSSTQGPLSAPFPAGWWVKPLPSYGSVDGSIVVPPPPGWRLRGRFVRIYNPGRFLSLAEVEVWGERNLTNTNGVAATATQSSEGWSGVPQRAVDGITDGNWASNSVTHTQFENQPWWQVDLGALRAVGLVEIFNRTDGTQGEPGRLSNFYVLASETPFTTNDLNTNVSNPAIMSSWVATASSTESTLVVIYTTARYIRVQLQGANFLSLAEVRVWGHDNLAVGKTATQSSTAYSNGGPEKAVDGNPDGAWRNDSTNSVTHTGYDVNAWWRVNLGPNRPSVASVQVWNRSDCCSDRLRDFRIVESTATGGTVSPAWTQLNGIAPELTTLLNFTADYGPPALPRLYFNINPYPQYLQVELTAQQFLSLAEVRVWGRKSVDDCDAPVNSIQRSYGDGTTGTIEDVVCGGMRMLRSTIKNAQNTPILRTTMRKPSDAGEVTIEWTWLTTGYTGYFPLPKSERQWNASELWQLEFAGKTANMLSRQIGQTADQAPPGAPAMDTMGCTLHAYNNNSDRGKCCDLQDVCYATHNCNLGSWNNNQDAACTKCNIDAVKCFAGVFDFNPSNPAFPNAQPSGPSSCVATNTCDRPVCGVEEGQTIWCYARPCEWLFFFGQTPSEEDTCSYNCGYENTVWKILDAPPGEVHACCPEGTGAPDTIGIHDTRVCR